MLMLTSFLGWELYFCRVHQFQKARGHLAHFSLKKRIMNFFVLVTNDWKENPSTRRDSSLTNVTCLRPACSKFTHTCPLIFPRLGWPLSLFFFYLDPIAEYCPGALSPS
jgi:hypothetical protein